MKKIILASGSPRRKKLLEQLGLKFEIKTSNFEEKIEPNLNPHTLVKKQSRGKAKNVAKLYKNALIIAADTMVYLNGKYIGKPITEKNARNALQQLSGKKHLIISGFTIIDTLTNKTITKSVETKVYFKKLTLKEIDDYIKTGEPLDKAGAYGIQEKGAIFVEKIEGDYFNVVGLPIFALVTELKKFDVKIM